MNISLFHSRNGLRYYLLQGIALSLLLIIISFSLCVWQVWHNGQQAMRSTEKVDAAVVLGAAAWGKRPSPVFRERINHAIALYQSGKVEKLIFTGGTPKTGYMTEAEVGRRYAIKQGVPAADIYFENTSRDTYQNLQNIQPILRDHAIETIVLVSDPFHTTRAQVMANDLGLQAITSATPTTRFNESRKKLKFLLQESYSLYLYELGKIGDKVLHFLHLEHTV